MPGAGTGYIQGVARPRSLPFAAAEANKPYMPTVDKDTGEVLIGALSADKIPGMGTTWNPSGLSEFHLKKLASGFYGWENEVPPPPRADLFPECYCAPNAPHASVFCVSRPQGLHAPQEVAR